MARVMATAAAENVQIFWPVFISSNMCNLSSACGAAAARRSWDGATSRAVARGRRTVVIGSSQGSFQDLDHILCGAPQHEQADALPDPLRRGAEHDPVLLPVGQDLHHSGPVEERLEPGG